MHRQSLCKSLLTLLSCGVFEIHSVVLPTMLLDLKSNIASFNKTAFFSQCYGKYGCYTIDYPYMNSHRVVNAYPRSPEEIRPQFKLYTRLNLKKATYLYEGSTLSVVRSHFDASR